MPRLTRSTYTDLLVWMVGFGLIIGLVFPPVLSLVGLPSEITITPHFFATTLAAGAVVGVVNGLLARLALQPRLETLASAMARVEQGIRASTWEEGGRSCASEECRVPVESEDELGEVAVTFNALV